MGGWRMHLVIQVFIAIYALAVLIAATVIGDQIAMWLAASAIVLSLVGMRLCWSSLRETTDRERGDHE